MSENTKAEKRESCYVSLTPSDPASAYLQGVTDAQSQIIQLLSEQTKLLALEFKEKLGLSGDSLVPEREAAILNTIVCCIELIASININKIERLDPSKIN